MKKWLSLPLAALCCLQLFLASALAAPITIDLDAATQEELTQLQSQIADRLSALRMSETPAGEVIELSGEGSAIHPLSIPFSPARVTCTAQGQPGAFKLTEGLFPYSFETDSTRTDVVEEAGDYTLLVECAGQWNFRVEPLAPGGALEQKGKGFYVSDIFPLDGPTIVNFSYQTAENGGNLIVYEYAVYEDGEVISNLLINEMPRNNASGSVEKILETTGGATGYFLTVYCDPATEWEISLP